MPKAMDDKTIQRKLNQLTKLTNELDAEAKRRWPSGHLFFESDGGFYLMSDDDDDDICKRQSYIEFSSDGYSSLGAGAW